MQFFLSDMIAFLKSTSFFISGDDSGDDSVLPYVAILSISEYRRFELVEILFTYTLEFHTFIGIDDTEISFMDLLAIKGDLPTLRFIHEKGATCTTKAMDFASSRGHLEIVRYLHENTTVGCREALFDASIAGQYEVVKYLCDNDICLDILEVTKNYTRRLYGNGRRPAGFVGNLWLNFPEIISYLEAKMKSRRESIPSL